MEDGFNKLSTGIFIERRLNEQDIAQLTKHKRSKRVVLTRIKSNNLDFLLPLKGLEDLSLYSCTFEDWTALHHLKKLKKLFINTVKNDTNNLGFLSGLESLEDLGIGYINDFDTFPDLSKCVSLRRISLFGNNKNLADLSNVSQIPSLDTFGITSSLLKPKDLEFIMQMPTIKNMSGSFGGKKVNDEFYALLAKHGIKYG